MGRDGGEWARQLRANLEDGERRERENMDKIMDKRRNEDINLGVLEIQDESE